MNYFTTITSKASLTISILMSLILTSCGDGGSFKNIKIPGVDGPRVQLIGDKILISMVFEKLTIDGGMRASIPEYPNSYIEVGPDFQSNGTLLAFNISLDDVLNIDIDKLNPTTLPGGRALPGVASGTLPAVAATIEKFHNISIYLGPKVFGMFVPLKKLGIGNNIISTRFYIGEKRMGNLSLVGEDDAGENAGILLMLDLSASTRRSLQRVARYN